MLGLDVLGGVIGFALPVVSDLVKSLFGKNKGPQATLTTLATTKPEVIPEYVKANAALLEAETKYFKRDMPEDSTRMPIWVLALRGAIRPIGTLICFLSLALNKFASLNLTPGTEASFCFILGAWFGSRVRGH
jgi:hypothetical protein